MTKRGRLLIFSVLFLRSPLVCHGQATVEGTVVLPKSHFAAPVANERYEIVSEAGVLKTIPPRAVVYLEGDFPKPSSLPAQQMAQKDLVFVPNLLPVEKGTKVEFPNLDDVYHNIFSYSPAKRFDLGRYPRDEKPTPFQIFDHAGLVTIRCDIHEHMRALILVLDTPYFTITDPKGHYRLTNLPPGQFALKAWMSSQATVQRPVNLRAGADLRVDLP